MAKQWLPLLPSLRQHAKTKNQFERSENLCSIVVRSDFSKWKLNCQRIGSTLTHIVALQRLRWLLVQLTEPVHQRGQLAAPGIGPLAVQHTRLELEAHIQCPLHGVAKHSRFPFDLVLLSSIFYCIWYFSTDIALFKYEHLFNWSRTTRRLSVGQTGLDTVWLCLQLFR